MENMDLSNLSITNIVNDSVISKMNNADSKTTSAAPESSFPSDVPKWMKKNAKPKMALKLMQVCKYFQHKEFPYLVVKALAAHHNAISYFDLNDDAHEWDDNEDIPSNLWITDVITASSDSDIFFISQLIPKVAVCEIKVLVLDDQEISFTDFKALTSSGTITEILCNQTYIRDETEEIAPFEDILTCIPNTETVYFRCGAPSFSTSAAAKEWILPKLKHVEFRFIDEDFNAETFITFMKEQKHVKFILCFLHSLFFEYARQLQQFVNEIIAAADLRYPPPHIAFTFQNAESKNALEALEKAYEEK